MKNFYDWADDHLVLFHLGAAVVGLILSGLYILYMIWEGN